MINQPPQQQEVFLSDTPLSSNTTKKNHLNAYSISDEEIQFSNSTPFHSDTLFIIQDDIYMTGKPTYEALRVESRDVTQQLSINVMNVDDSRGNVSFSSMNPKSLDSHILESSTSKNIHLTNGGSQKQNVETSQMSKPHVSNSKKKKNSKYTCCSSLLIKIFTFTNIFILMFIVEGLIGVGSSFILSHSAGEQILSHSRQYQRLQLQIYINSELKRFISNISIMSNHVAMQLNRLSLNDNLALIKMFDSIDTHFTPKIGATAYRWVRFDDFYFSRQFNENVNGYIVRVYNPLQQIFKYYNVSKEIMQRARSGSELDLFDYFNGNDISSFYELNTEFHPKKREYYLPYDKGNESCTDIRWSDSWTDLNDQYVITLSIPVYSNYSTEFFKDSNNSYLINSMLHPKYINVPNVQTSKFPHLKKPQNLFGVVIVQFSWESLSSTILNESNSGPNIPNTDDDRIEYSMIVDSKYNLIGKKSEHDIILIIYQVLKDRKLLSFILTPCGNMTTNSTNSEITSYGTVFFVIDPGRYGNWSLSESIEVEIAPICDRYGIDWFVVVGNYRSSFLVELNRNPEFLSSLLIMVFIQVIFLIFSVVNIRVSFSFVRKTAISILTLKNENDSTSKNLLSRFWKAIEKFTFFVDVIEMRMNLSMIRNGLMTFSKYVPDLVVKAFKERDGPFDKINLAKREMTILITELVGFSELSHGIHGDCLPDLVKHYFTIVSKAVREEGGIIVQYIGDRAVCVFNVHCLPLECHEIKACRAALKIMMNIENFNRIHGSDLRVRSSIASDSILYGNTGSQRRMNTTVVGSSVHIAKALLMLNKHVGKKILLHEKTYLKVQEKFVCNFVDCVSLGIFKFSVYSLESIFSLLTEEQEVIHNASFQMEAALTRLDFATLIDICKKYEMKDESFNRMRKRALELQMHHSIDSSGHENYDISFKLR